MPGYDPSAIVESYDPAGGPGAPARGIQLGQAVSGSLRNFAAGFADIGGALGSQDAADYAAQQRRLANENATASGLPQSYNDVHGIGSALGYVGNQFIQAAPYIATAAIGAGAGGAASAALGITRGAGAIAGGLAASYPGNLGQVLGAQAEESGKYDLPSAAALALPFTALDLLGPEGRTITGGMTGMTAKSVVGRMGQRLVAGAAGGAAQQTGQDVLLETARAAVNPDYDPTSDAAQSRFTERLVGGLALGAATHITGGKEARETPVAQDRPTETPVAQDRPTEMLRLPAPADFVASADGTVAARGDAYAGPQGNLFRSINDPATEGLPSDRPTSAPDPQTEPGTPLLDSKPMSTLPPERAALFNQTNVLQKLREAVPSENGQPGKADAYTLKLANELAGHLTDGDHEAATDALDKRQTALEDGRLAESTIPKRQAQIDAARQIVDTARAHTEDAVAREAAPPPVEAPPATHADVPAQEQQAAAVASPAPVGPSPEEVAAHRAGILDTVLGDPETRNPLNRSIAELKRQGHDGALSAAETQKIAQFEAQREAGQPSVAPEPNTGVADRAPEPNTGVVDRAPEPAPVEKPALVAERAPEAPVDPNQPRPERGGTAPAAEPKPVAEKPSLADTRQQRAQDAQTLKDLKASLETAQKQGAISVGERVKHGVDLNKEGMGAVPKVQAFLAHASLEHEANLKAGTAKPGEGMHAADVQAAVDAASKDLKGLPKVNVVQSATDLPRHVRAALGDRQAAGVTLGGTVHLVADHLRSPEEATATLYHETIGHVGLDRAFGAQLNAKLDEIYKGNTAARAEVDARLASGDHSYAHLDAESQRRRVTEELIAEASEKGPQAGGVSALFDRLKAVVSQFARRIGLTKAMSDAEVRQILRQAHETITNPSPARSVAEGTQKTSNTSDGAVEVRLRAAPASLDEAKDKVAFFVKDVVTDGTFKFKQGLDAIMPVNEIEKHFGKELPSIKPYNEINHRMGARTREIAEVATHIRDRWDSLKGAEGDAVGALLNHATEHQVNPIDGTGKDKAQFADAVQQHARLSAEGKAVYRDVLKFFADQRASDKAVIMASHAKIEDPAERALAEKNTQQQFAKALKVYFPLRRTGEYRLAAHDEEGGKIYEAFDSHADRQRAADAYEKVGMQVDQFQTGDYSRALDGISLKARDAWKAAVETHADGKQLSALVDQLYWQHLPETSSTKSRLARATIQGYSKDAQRTFAGAAQSSAFASSRLEFAETAREHLTNVGNEAKAVGSARLSDIYNKLSQGHNAMLTNRPGGLASRLPAYAFLYYLGFNPALAIKHFLQTPLVTLPVLMGRHGVRGATELVKAIGDVTSSMKHAYVNADADSVTGKIGQAAKGWITSMEASGRLTSAEVSAIGRAQDKGTIDLTQARNLAAEAAGASKAFLAVQRATAWMPHHVEKANRVATFVAALRLGKLDGMSDAAAEEHANRVTLETHVDYSSANESALSKTTPMAKILFQFKKYQLQMAANWANNIRGSFVGSAEEKAIARRTLFGMAVTHLTAAGTLGLPLVGMLGKAIASGANAAFGNPDEPFDASAAYQKWLTDVFSGGDPDSAVGHRLGTMFAKGLPAAAGVDLSASGIGQQDIFSPVKTAPGGRGNTLEQLKDLAFAALGPVGGMAGDFAQGIDQLYQGNHIKAIEHFLPKSISHVVRAGRFATQGLTTGKGDEVITPADLGPGGVLTTAIGFQPTKVDDYYDRTRATQALQHQVAARRDELVGNLRDAAGDPSAMSDGYKAIAEHNQSAAAQGLAAITGGQIAKALSSPNAKAAKQALAQAKHPGLARLTNYGSPTSQR